jgi:hypothetical protein
MNFDKRLAGASSVKEAQQQKLVSLLGGDEHNMVGYCIGSHSRIARERQIWRGWVDYAKEEREPSGYSGKCLISINLLGVLVQYYKYTSFRELCIVQSHNVPHTVF